ncbi:MAG: NAD(P)/FAD-dependent oxidoreductase [Candidatus Helarchaeota archaeon]
MKWDVVVIGAGVIGCTIARNLSKYSLKSLVIEKDADVCCGTSKANSGIVHGGYDAKPGTLKAKFNVAGNPLFDQICNDLKVPFRRCGSFVVSTDDSGIERLEKLYERGVQNGVKTEIITDKKKIKEMEPSLTENANGVLFSPTAGIVSPYDLTIASAENANINGVEFKFNSEVKDIKIKESKKIILTDKEQIETDYIINAAGVYADKISKMVGLDYFEIVPRRGEYVLFDKETIPLNRPLFPLPTKESKGILAAPTLHGHVFFGPNAINIEEKEDISTTAEGLEEIISGGLKLLPSINLRNIITNFAGLRAVSDNNDFIIEETKIKGFINVAGIQSPGLASSLAIANEVIEILKNSGLKLPENKSFNPIREKPVAIHTLSHEEKDALIKKDDRYGKIVCRCEHVSEGEVIDAIHRPIGAKTLDGIKFRTRAGMGRCQAGFCTARTVKILSDELKIAIEQVSKSGPGSELFISRTKSKSVWEDKK